jgi:hypothetical protein
MGGGGVTTPKTPSGYATVFQNQVILFYFFYLFFFEFQSIPNVGYFIKVSTFYSLFPKSF